MDYHYYANEDSKQAPIPIPVALPVADVDELKIELANKYHMNRAMIFFAALLVAFWPYEYSKIWLVAFLMINNLACYCIERYVSDWEQKKLKLWRADMIARAIMEHKNHGDCHEPQDSQPKS